MFMLLEQDDQSLYRKHNQHILLEKNGCLSLLDSTLRRRNHLISGGLLPDPLAIPLGRVVAWPLVSTKTTIQYLSREALRFLSYEASDEKQNSMETVSF